MVIVPSARLAFGVWSLSFGVCCAFGAFIFWCLEFIVWCFMVHKPTELTKPLKPLKPFEPLNLLNLLNP